MKRAPGAQPCLTYRDYPRVRAGPGLHPTPTPRHNRLQRENEEKMEEKMVSLHFLGSCHAAGETVPVPDAGSHAFAGSLMACAPAVGAAQSGRVQRSALLRVSAPVESR